MKWEKRNISPELVKNLDAKYQCGPITASILARRDLIEGETIQFFLENDPRYLHNPFDLPGMEDAVDRILAAKEEGEKVLVFGDRDVDGITSTVLLWEYLSGLGLDIQWRIPQGDDVYGLSREAVEEFAAGLGTLIITVDCGISNAAEVARANELGVDVIVTDHHNPRQEEELPEAYSIVNPKLAGSHYPFRDLSGCGVAFKLVCALRFAQRSSFYGQEVALLNVRAANDAWTIEVVKLRNLAVVEKLIETVVPGVARITDTRLPVFLEGQQILAWDAPLQTQILTRIFGKGVEIAMLDIAPEIAKEIPRSRGQSLLRLREESRLARYAGGEITELDVFLNLFVSFVRKREKLWTAQDAEGLQLASLGTMADIMPLRNENRIIVWNGIESIKAKPRPGISELLFKLGLAGAHFGSKEISWQLNPAINAAGRMGKPEIAVNLLLEQDPATRDKLAAELIGLNDERKKLGEETWNIVEPMAAENIERFNNNLALAFGENINRGVTGIMSTRLVKRFDVPALVVSFIGDTATGSLRSIKGYNLRPLLEQCADLFLDWGGHDRAAGFSMQRAKWEELFERLIYVSAAMEFSSAESPGGDGETIQTDAELPQRYLTPEIIDIVEQFEPYGEENEPLTFMTRNARISDISLMGKNGAKHVRLTLDTGAYKWPAVYWQAADKIPGEFDMNDVVDIIFSMSRNWFNGDGKPQLIIADLKRSAVATAGSTG
ncbi:MAG: single-stranded-DNA-specific exonuclease RecJ [Treponema sp.]|jgi:single-stranded-DNA-specific exonuclease|nr:single-stranded-DNA-specific exonuclease RecJ [Treponema sp.]